MGFALLAPIALFSQPLSSKEWAIFLYSRKKTDMGTSPETFDQVKNILRKLDRSITDARQRRLNTDESPRQAAPRAPSRPSPVGLALCPRPEGFRGDLNPSPRF